jgi:hypothetical protein
MGIILSLKNLSFFAIFSIFEQKTWGRFPIVGMTEMNPLNLNRVMPAKGK